MKSPKSFYATMHVKYVRTYLPEIFLLHSFASIKLSINATLDLKHFRERTLTDLPMRLEIYPRKRK